MSMIHSGNLLRYHRVVGSKRAQVVVNNNGSYYLPLVVRSFKAMTQTSNSVEKVNTVIANETKSHHATSQTATLPPLQVPPTQLLAQGTNTHNLGRIVRHGCGDACITINVGGREFYTLRSTIAMNSVLADHVARAELNHEVVRNGAVFIDRDPEHFPILLKYLRNRVEYEALRSHVDKASLKKIVKSFIDLPSDPKVLRELYVEAVFYRMKDLEIMLKDTSVLVQMASVLSKTTGGAAINPFDWLIRFWAQLRALMVGATVVGGSYLMAVQNEWNWILQRLGLRKKDRRTRSEIFE
jgi:BTB/POZ domain